MGASRISAFLRRLDALQERAARARHAWQQAKAMSDERRLLLTGTKGHLASESRGVAPSEKKGPLSATGIRRCNLEER